jgi:nitrogen regulatory protein PII
VTNDPTTPRKLVTIITESVLEPKLIRDVTKLGASGYTITDARGKGNRGVRSAAWEQASNIRIEIVCETAIADAIAEHVKKKYYSDYAMIVTLSNVQVLRPEKF